MTKKMELSEEEVAKVISVAIFGYICGVENRELTQEQVKHIYESTLESIKDGGFIEELITVYDESLFDELKQEADKLHG